MAILNFCDIRAPVKFRKRENLPDATLHLDDFEKFAQDFFRTIYNAKILSPIGRGQDGGIDLKIEANIFGSTETMMVSCKHTAHGGKAVGEDSERYFLQNFKASGCERFIGFYSHIQTKSFARLLENLERNEPGFKFGIFNSADIEAALLSAENGKGWFLASRYFPTSYSKLFKRFLEPIRHYEYKDIRELNSSTLVLEGPGGSTSSFREGGKRNREFVAEEMVRTANEYLTFVTHESFLAEVMQDVTERFPECFEYWTLRDSGDLRCEDIRPTFTADSLVSVANRRGMGGEILVAALWTRWSFDRAVDCYVDARAKMQAAISEKAAVRLLSLTAIACRSRLDDTELLARFVAFSGTNASDKSVWTEKIDIAITNGLADIVKCRIIELVGRLSTDSQMWLERTAGWNILTLDYLTRLSSLLEPNQLEQFFLEIDSRFEDNFYSSFTTLLDAQKRWKVGTTGCFTWHEERLGKSHLSW